jgi:outer membrane protein assembly factor BamB
MVAARNVEAAGLWDEVTGTAVAAEVRSLGRHVPEEWRERWEALPEVAAALATPEASPADAEEAAAELQESLQRVFQEVGLAGADHVLSPAQRRAAGITIRRRRRRPLWQVLTFAGAIVAVGAVAAVALTLALQPSEGTTTIIEQPGPTVVLTLPPTTTLPPEPVENQLPRPETPLTTQWAFGGERPFDAGERGLTGVADVSGVREAAGYYWRVDTNDPIPATIVGRGRNLFVGNLSGSFFIYETNGRLHRTLSPDTNRGFTTAATAELVGAMGTTESGSRLDIVLFGDTEGRLHAADGGDGFELPRAEWDAVTGGAISTVPLVVGDLALVGSRDGYVHAFSLSDGGELRWRFPADDMDIEPSTPVDGLALMDGVVYVVREDQSLYGLDPETGLLASNGSGPLCAVPSPDLNGTPLVHPVAVDGYVYVSAGPFVYRFNAANCGVPTTVAFHGGEASAAPAVDIENGVLWQPIGFFVLRFDISMGLFPADYTCSYPLEGGRVRIRSAPAVARPEGADPIVYFGDDAGTLHAIDGETCDLLWSWPTEVAIISSPALGDRVVFITSEDGTITAIGPAPGGE